MRLDPECGRNHQERGADAEGAAAVRLVGRHGPVGRIEVLGIEGQAGAKGHLPEGEAGVAAVADAEAVFILHEHGFVAGIGQGRQFGAWSFPGRSRA